MKKEFFGYYAPTEDEYERLWQEGLVVLDANVLLDLYRLPASARDELISVLEILKDRLWIPYQVALEFQRRRLSVIASERQGVERSLSEAKRLFEQISEQVNLLQIDKRGLGLESRPLVDGLNVVKDKLILALESASAAQLDISVSDPVRDKLDSLLEGRVGSPPGSQKDLDELVGDGERRYENKIPPGFADAEKEKNPNEATFCHDGLTYKRKFGDLILWRQIIHHARDHGKELILFITSDRKEDWWWRERGKTIGPRPELSRELKLRAKGKLFWMYSADQFLENAKKFTRLQISDKSVSELREVANLRISDLGIGRPDWNELRDFSYRDSMLYIEDIDPRFAVNGVNLWLLRRFGSVDRSAAFPDFIVEDGEGFHGFEVKSGRGTSFAVFSRWVAEAIDKGSLSVLNGRLARFSLVIVVSSRDLEKLLPGRFFETVRDNISITPEHVSSHEIFVGVIDTNKDFVPKFNIKILTHEIIVRIYEE